MLGPLLRARSVVGYLLTALALGAAVGLVLLLDKTLGVLVPNAGVLYLLVLLASAYWLGTRPALLGLLVSLAAIAYLYLPIDSSPIAFAVRFAIISCALIVGIILARLAREAGAERERLLEAERAARAQAVEALKLRDEFLSVAAHELKTPVTSLKGFVQILIRKQAQDGTVGPGELVRALTVIDRQAKKLTRLVEQLLEISRLQNGKLTLSTEEVAISPLVESTISAVRQVRPGRLFIFEVGTPARAQIDPLRIEQVIANLLDNAAKFSPEDTPIEIETRRCPCGQIEISVRDYGPGVPDAERETIFERFEQGHVAGHREGLGLGLYISRQIVEMHGGTITCEAPDGGGARFVVRLPVGATAHSGEPCQEVSSV